MPTLCLQTIVCGKTIQVTLLPEEVTAKIYIVNEDLSVQTPRTLSVEQYVKSGMSEEDIARHILDVVTTSVEELVRIQALGPKGGHESGAMHRRKH
ncbi:hypothetical protein [Burkholderia anthinoferrum]|uniref:hypothetical protein n=1 Tax=Burkholderia anthinoferrum TaxID=3090833 RepID=UPI000CE1AC25|nr:hypothetical protein [Burkholderia anthinoferrum]